MNKKFVIAAVIALIGVSAYAQSSYLEIGVGSAKYSEPGLTLTPSIVRGILGVEINQNVALEAMLATGLSTYSTTYSGVGVTMKVDNATGVYIKPKLKINENTELFARAGVTYVSGTLTVTGNRGSLVLVGSGNSASFGGGLKANLSKDSYMVADYMSYYSKNGSTVSGFTLGVGFTY